MVQTSERDNGVVRGEDLLLGAERSPQVRHQRQLHPPGPGQREVRGVRRVRGARVILAAGPARGTPLPLSLCGYDPYIILYRSSVSIKALFSKEKKGFI